MKKEFTASRDFPDPHLIARKLAIIINITYSNVIDQKDIISWLWLELANMNYSH